ncbi:phosphotransferase [Nocardia sp. NPDC003693]
MAGVEEVKIVVAHQQRVTVRVGDVFLEIDGDQARLDAEVTAMVAAPIPTPNILWRKPSVLALSALRGSALGRLGEPSSAVPAAWAAAGEALRTLHNAPLPPRPTRTPNHLAAELDAECAWLVRNDVLPAETITANREIAQAAIRSFTPAFIHGDLQLEHVFVDGDEITGVIDWSEAAQGDPAYDIATLTLGHPEHLEDVLSGYGTRVDLEVIRAWWSARSLRGVRWLIEHGIDPGAPGREIDVLRAQASRRETDRAW